MPLSNAAQNTVKGVVNSIENGKKVPLPGAVVGWAGTQFTTFTDENGKFSIDKKPGQHMLYAAFLGLKPDTVHVGETNSVIFNLEFADMELDEVQVRDKTSAVGIKKRDVSLTQLITAKELTKAACCNLSESFETNPAIDANFTDAVTGTRQIRLLGLDGPYSYYTRGNIPTLGGIASVLGLQLIPGNWIQSIQLTKGSGSVLNGFESVAGQVNYELRQPDGREAIFGQLYANGSGRLEQSAVYNIDINKKWSTNLLAYGRQQIGNPDFNKDGFLDMPQGAMWIGHSTWKYHGTKGWESNFGFKYAVNNQTGGETGAINAAKTDSVWQAFMKTNRFEFWQKTGYVFKNAPYRSVGLQLAFTYHNQTSDFGLPTVKTYGGVEKSVYANLIFQDIIVNTNHQYKVGISYKSQNIDETYAYNLYLRREQIPGVFGEYTYLYLEDLSVVGGLRYDYHSQYGPFFTPRLHIRYAPFKNQTFRINIGKAYRTANLFADHIGSMASNRVWNITQNDEAIPYNGIKQEESINAGISYNYTFELDFRPGSITAEYFYTTFQNQLVKDWDAATTTLNFYNLNGQSFAHSAQIQVDYEVIQRLNLRVAYRYVDAKTTYNSIGLARQPFIAEHRVFGNVGYQTRNMFKFDATVNGMSNQRLPGTKSNPLPDQRADFTPAYTTVNVQLSKEFREKLEVHIGVENLFGYEQENPIVSVDNPFAPQFDASMIWAPIMGSVIYAGIRVNLLKKLK